MEKYINRQQAGEILAHALQEYANRKDVEILALPRGGIPVAFEIAKALHLPMDVFIVRKLGVPGHKELAMGAIAFNGSSVFNEDIIRDLNISQEEIRAVMTEESQEVTRRNKAYRGNKSFPALENKTIILVDDGIATGATLRAAILALKKFNPASIIAAVPVAQKDLCEEMAKLVNKLVCPLKPLHFNAVGIWYDNFSQVEDDEVYKLLNEIKKYQDDRQ